jgi:hypothetical protein
MKIGKLINAQTTLVPIGTSADPDIVIAETLDLAKYTDITSIINWDLYGLRISTMEITRMGIKLLCDLVDWSTLSEVEKVICARYFVTTVANRNSVLSEDEQKMYGDRLIKRDKKDKGETEYGNAIFDKEPSDVDSKIGNVNSSFPGYAEKFEEISPAALNAWHAITVTVEPNSIVFISADTASRDKTVGIREVGSS